VGFSGWDANKVVLEDQVFELSWGPQRIRDGQQAVLEAALDVVQMIAPSGTYFRQAGSSR
jgi:hypothetical protein